MTPAGTLYVVATPIGNLEDITLRALNLREVGPVVAAEDTRRTAALLRHYDIKTVPIVSVREQTNEGRGVKIACAARKGRVRWRWSPMPERRVCRIPEPSWSGRNSNGRFSNRTDSPAPVRSLRQSAAGIHSDRFISLGFPPIRGKDRKRWLRWVEAYKTPSSSLLRGPAQGA